jgi:hypothetical protein
MIFLLTKQNIPVQKQRSNILNNIFINFQNLSKFGSDVVTPVLQSLYSITEDNSQAATAVREREGSLKMFLEVTIKDFVALAITVIQKQMYNRDLQCNVC